VVSPKGSVCILICNAPDPRIGQHFIPAGIPWHHVNLYLYKLPGNCHEKNQSRAEFDWFRRVSIVEVNAKAEEWEVKRYLTHIASNYETLEDFTIFAHPDALEHINPRTLRNLMQTLLFGVLEVSGHDDDWYGYFSLSNHYLRNSSRVKNPVGDCTKSPSFTWLQTRLGLSTDIAESHGFYCCSQFIVHKARIKTRLRDWYSDAVSIPWDHCLTSYMEILWQLVFSEEMELRRQEQAAMPLFLRVDNFYEEATDNGV